MSSLRARSLINLALLLVVAALAALIWLMPPRHSPPAEESLTHLNPAKIRRVRIERPGAEAIELRRNGSGWRLTAPRNLPGSGFRGDALAALAAARVHAGFRAEGNDLAQFDLEPPKARVLLDDQAILFGGTDALNGWRYVRYGTDVHLITDVFFHHLLAPPAAFVAPEPIANGARPVAFALPGAKLDLDDGRWRLDSAHSLDGAEVGKRFAEAWTSARASSVKPFDAGLRWQDEIQVRLQGQPAPVRFRVARLDHEVVLGRPDWEVQYHFPQSAGRRLIAPGG